MIINVYCLLISYILLNKLYFFVCSTVSSSINSVSSLVIEDIVLAIWPKLNQRKVMVIGKILGNR